MIVSLHGIRMTALVQSWSVIVSIESKPFDSGNLTMKSIATVSKGSAPGFCEYRAQWGSSSLVVHFVALAVCASFDVVFDILNHMGPPVSSCREFQGSGDSWMAIGWWVMMHLYYGTS